MAADTPPDDPVAQNEAVADESDVSTISILSFDDRWPLFLLEAWKAIRHHQNR
jgi:hypothetical protein